MRAKLIVVEGTDCSGKETQTKLLINRLNTEGISTTRMQFPMYDTPTGRILAGPVLGKPAYGKCYFGEGAGKINGKVASLYFAADRVYNIDKVTNLLDSGTNVVLDRYVDSNKVHQCSKIEDEDERNKQYKFIDDLEYGFLGLPKADIKIMLYMPLEYREVLQKGRTEEADDVEKDMVYQRASIKACLEVAKRDGYLLINCVEGGQIKTIDDIHQEIYNYVKEKLK